MTLLSSQPEKRGNEKGFYPRLPLFRSGTSTSVQPMEFFCNLQNRMPSSFLTFFLLLLVWIGLFHTLGMYEMGGLFNVFQLFVSISLCLNESPMLVCVYCFRLLTRPRFPRVFSRNSSFKKDLPIVSYVMAFFPTKGIKKQQWKSTTVV